MSLLVNSLPEVNSIDPKINSSTSPGASPSGFSNILKDAIENVNDTQIASDKQTEAFMNGDNEDLHQVMIAAQKASITLETTVQIQRKAIDAYNEIMRMQV